MCIGMGTNLPALWVPKIQSRNESTEFRYKTTGYKTIVGLKKARVLTDRGFRTTEYQQT